MTPDVRAALQRLAKVRSLATRQVFLYERQPLRDFRTAFRTAMKDAGVSGFRFHDLRHWAATNLRRAGIDMTVAMQIVGHTSPHMWKRYNKNQEHDLAQAALKLDRYFRLTPR